jgi:hypothetical protein
MDHHNHTESLHESYSQPALITYKYTYMETKLTINNDIFTNNTTIDFNTIMNQIIGENI